VVATGCGDLSKLQRLLIAAKKEDKKWSEIYPLLHDYLGGFETETDKTLSEQTKAEKLVNTADLVYVVMTYPGLDKIFARSGIPWNILSRTLEETKGSDKRAEMIEKMSTIKPVDDDGELDELIERMQMTQEAAQPQIEEPENDKKLVVAGKGETFLETHGVELVSRAHSFDPVVGREDQITRTIHILCRRSKRNACLVGYPGVGKTAIVEEIARRIAERKVPLILQDCKIWSINMGSLVSGSRLRGQFEKKMQRLIAELKDDPKAILFLDEIHLTIGAGRAEGGTMDSANLLKPVLSRGEIRCIGATTYDEYKENIEKDLAFARRFVVVDVPEPSPDLAVEMLIGLKPLYEKFHGLEIPDEVIKFIVECSHEHNLETKSKIRRLPDSAIDLLDEACVSCASESKTILTRQDVTFSRSRL